jgi:uncharacterized protein (DUF4415 family)
MKQLSTLKTLDNPPALKRSDVTAGKLVLRQRATSGRLLPNKQRINIFLDQSVVEHFKDKAGERGYQTLINESLREAIHRESLETTIRKTIRTELRAARRVV